MHPKIRRPKPCLLKFASLLALAGFHLLLSTQLTANLTREWCGGSMFHPLSHTYRKKKLFFCVETVTIERSESLTCFLIDCEQTRLPLSTQLSHWQMFMQNDEYTAFWYLQLLFNLWSVKMNLWNFLVFSRSTAEFGQPKRSASFLSVRPRLKSAYHLLSIFSDWAESD